MPLPSLPLPLPFCSSNTSSYPTHQNGTTSLGVASSAATRKHVSGSRKSLVEEGVDKKATDIETSIDGTQSLVEGGTAKELVHNTKVKLLSGNFDVLVISEIFYCFFEAL